jgi:hypothetical protein
MSERLKLGIIRLMKAAVAVGWVLVVIGGAYLLVKPHFIWRKQMIAGALVVCAMYFVTYRKLNITDPEPVLTLQQSVILAAAMLVIAAFLAFS